MKHDPSTILLVDDDADVRLVLREILRSRGYRVLEARDAREALATSDLHAGLIDLLVTDVELPGMNGRELSDAIRKKRPETKVLLMSGHSLQMLAGYGVTKRGTTLLAKPFSIDELARRICQLLEGPPTRYPS